MDLLYTTTRCCGLKKIFLLDDPAVFNRSAGWEGTNRRWGETAKCHVLMTKKNHAALFPRIEPRPLTPDHMTSHPNKRHSIKIRENSKFREIILFLQLPPLIDISPSSDFRLLVAMVKTFVRNVRPFGLFMTVQIYQYTRRHSTQEFCVHLPT